jgi:uncharacterized protein (DUF1697 family)
LRSQVSYKLRMPRYVALLRGVGPNKPVPTARLRSALEALGYAEVATVLATGNAAFTTGEKNEAKMVRRIEAALAREFGFELRVVVRTRDELAAVIRDNPLRGAEDDPSRFLVTFLSGIPDPKQLDALDPASFLPEQFHVAGRDIYARHPNGIGRSKLAMKLSSLKLGATPTARNWNTVKKLLALADG